MSVTIGSGHEGNVREQLTAYKARVKGGEMGALPSVLSLFVLTFLFAALNPFFLTQGNFANLLTQTATLMMLAMALVFVILLAEIDLSAGVTSGVAMALFIIMTNRWEIDWRISIVAVLP
jgi:D-xylose transport system permease protein